MPGSKLLCLLMALWAGATPVVARDTLVYIGTHGSGPGQGIWVAKLDQATGALSGLALGAEIERPTWLVADPRRPILYSVSETGNDGKTQGGVYSLAIDKASGSLHVIDRADSGGGGATHLAYDPQLPTLFVANYGTGQVAAIPVQPDGSLSSASSVQANYGSGPSPRQKSPHAHSVAVAPGGRFVLSADLGADRLFVYRFDRASRKLAPGEPPFAPFPAGSGPRHIAFTPDGRFVFVDTELSGEVYGYRWDGQSGHLSPAGRTALDAADYAGTKSAAELAISRDGHFLYVSNRGENLLQVYAIDRGTGALAEIQRIACGGTVPWSFGIDPSGHWMIVANEASSTLTVFAVDPAAGRLAATASMLSVPKPVAIAYHQE